MAVLPSYKEIVDLLKKGATLEAQEKIMELREAVVVLQDENIALKQKVAELEQKLQIRSALVWRPPLYWLQEEQGERGPFCQRCYDVNGRLVRLQNPERGFWRCLECKNNYFSDDYRPPEAFIATTGPKWD